MVLGAYVIPSDKSSLGNLPKATVVGAGGGGKIEFIKFLPKLITIKNTIIAKPAKIILVNVLLKNVEAEVNVAIIF